MCYILIGIIGFTRKKPHFSCGFWYHSLLIYVYIIIALFILWEQPYLPRYCYTIL